MANAAGHLRANESCDANTFGLTSRTTGKHGPTGINLNSCNSHNHTKTISDSDNYDRTWRPRNNCVFVR